jgi:hypothetical protein
MDGERDHLPGEHPLSELARLFNPEQAFLFHHLSDCFFRKTRFPRYPIVQVTPGNGRQIQVVGGVFSMASAMSLDVYVTATIASPSDGCILAKHTSSRRRRPRLALAFSERYPCGSMSLHPPGFIEPCLPTGSRTAPTGIRYQERLERL